MGAAWPKYITQRAKARALSAEMHSGFMALRSEMPMNIRATRKVDLSSEALKDIARIDEIFAQQQDVFPNERFFGDFSIADAMYVPIVLRLKTYRTVYVELVYIWHAYGIQNNVYSVNQPKNQVPQTNIAALEQKK